MQTRNAMAPDTSSHIAGPPTAPGGTPPGVPAPAGVSPAPDAAVASGPDTGAPARPDMTPAPLPGSPGKPLSDAAALIRGPSGTRDESDGIDISPHMALLTCNLIWGLNYTIYTIIMPAYIRPIAMLTVALGIAALCSLGAMIFTRNERIDRKDFLGLVMAAVSIGILRKFFLMQGMSHTGAIDGAAIATVSPILVLMMSVWLGREDYNVWKMVGTLLGVCGAVLIMIVSFTDPDSGDHALGNVYMVISTLCTSFYMVWFKQLIRKYRPITLIKWIYLIAFVLVAPVGIEPVLRTDFAAMPPEVWYAFIFAAVVPTFLPNYMLLYGLHRVGPATGVTFSYVQSLLTILLAVLYHTDILRPYRVVATLLIIGGVWLVMRGYRDAARSPVQHFE